ncbi:MAG: valine--tRNA ligase [Kiritimatiellaceae bacterium TMED266]|nr:MAG: valine--tRNA ligase [Kiritimatiellaceae bacterium TMED266]
MAKLAKSYDPKICEEKWYKTWMDEGCFHAEPSDKGEPFSIMIPPPNVTGILHMGHALNNTIQDVLIRVARMEGKNAVWVPGTDHAGIATQTKVERLIREESGQTKHDLGREEFVNRIWDFRNESGGIILNQLKKLGASCDWERTRFTLDEGYSNAVLQAFVTLYERGFIYRGNRMVNWCPGTQTAISDEEVIMKPQQGFLYKLRYELVDKSGGLTHLEISTTRPETIMGDTAVAVHPEDERYKHLIGQQIWRPYPKAKIPIIGDAYVDRAFGTGCLKVTPAHDKNDFEIGQRHHLEIIEVIDESGFLNETAGELFAGLERFDARQKVIEQLDSDGLLIEKEPYENSVGFSERADVPIEPRLSEQWFLKYPKVEEAKRAVEEGIVTFHPDRWKKTYLHWLNGIQDWCISRQLWWGHRIPVWYRKGISKDALDYSNSEHVYVSTNPPEDLENWEQDPDVLDTWASSYLWPMANLGWPTPDELTAKELQTWYPTSTLVTGFDIIFFWVARMIMAGLELYGDDKKDLSNEEISARIPFKDIYIHGTVRDDQGRKMSKSLGNSIDPLSIIEKYSSDALRFSLLMITATGQDVYINDEKFEIGRNFMTKLWNAARFMEMHSEGTDWQSVELEQVELAPDDHYILSKLNETIEAVNENLSRYRFNDATLALYDFFWHSYCDRYLEYSKPLLYRGSEEEKLRTLAVMHFVFSTAIRLLHPFMPFLTEELWEGMAYNQSCRHIIKAPWPADKIFLSLDMETVEYVDAKHDLIRVGRILRSDYGLALKQEASFMIRSQNEEMVRRITADRDSISAAIKAASLEVGIEVEPSGPMPSGLSSLGTIYMSIEGLVDIEAELKKMSAELKTIEGHLKGVQGKLNNSNFVEKAPEDVVNVQREKEAELLAKRDKLSQMISMISGA